MGCLVCLQDDDGDLLRLQLAHPLPSSRTGMAGGKRVGRPRQGAGENYAQKYLLAPMQVIPCVQVEESTIRQRLGGRRDSATQICSISPPTETQETSPPTTGGTRRRRSSLAQLTDILREWGGGSTKTRQKAPLCR